MENHTGIALAENGDCTQVYEEARSGRRSTYLLSVVDDLLKEQGWALDALDGLAVCTGPGTFTGIRVGMAVARGLAHGASLPLVGVNAFDAYAAQWSPEATLILALDARRGEIYTQVRQSSGEMGAPRTQTPEALVRSIGEDSSAPHAVLNGDALALYEDQWSEIQGVSLAPASERNLRVAAVAAVGFTRLSAQKKGLDPVMIQPSYIRRSDKDLQLK